MTAILRIEFCRYFGFYLLVLSGFFGRHCTADVDECQKLPCLNGGTCLNNQGGSSYQCICMNGWTGVNCEINVDDCAKGPCLAGGTCRDKVGSYVCECPRGKTGLRCHLDDACISNPCHSGAVCETSPLNGDYMCSCPPGMNGTDCTVDINECIETALTPCEQGGTCVNTVGSFHCNCRNGFSGPRCEVNINECQSSPCRNDGTCLDKIGMFQCLCMDGFTGVTCQTQVNECVSAPCQNGGTCQDRIGYYVCSCPPGYSGTTCQMEIQECNSNPCQYGGNCTERINGFLCQCPPGTSGDRCQVNNNQCAKNNCLNGASCLRGANNFTCICLPGFSGPECEWDIDECSSRPCQNGGTCTDLINGFRCDCASGYTDVTCGANLRDCRVNQCLNGGTCTNSYECQCTDGYTGFRCETEVNECNSNPCQHGGSCIDGRNLYSCVCPAGFTGGNCEFNGNDCSPNPCQNGGQCIDGINGYACVCNRSYSGRNCETKINVCTSNVCQNGGQCSSDESLSGFICKCQKGFMGERCSDDVDECVVGSGNPCRNGGTCRNSIGSYSCFCPSGYSGQMCEVNSNDCSSDSCRNGGTCVDGLNNYTCFCVPGYNGNKCQFDVNECQSLPCQNGATCNNYVNSYTCTCAPGFSGTNCQINDNDCTSSLCLNGGTCVDGVNTYSCRCPSGYDRRNCEHQVTACDSNPCLNDGSCEVSGGSYRCFCAPGWTGQSCNILVDWCGQVDPVCRNGGTCGATGNTFQCSCAVGWTGNQCDVANVSCAVAARERGVNVSALCHNGGTCYNYNSAHQCACSPGYEGTYCENKTDNCRSQPCLNGANCSNVNASFQCSCRPGFTSKDCSVNINECQSSPCRNNGTCHDLVNGFQCSCPPGTSGIYCEINPDDCLPPGSCQNGGTCYDKINGYGCHCAPGFTGPNCQGDIDECGSGPCSGPGILGCVQGRGTFTCLCKPGWTGANCSGYVSQCAAAAGSNPCERGGTCVDLGGGPSSFKCTCPPGFGGLYCQNGSCENNPCQNGGSCSLVGGQSLCQCPPDYTGKTCDQLMNTAAICEANNCKSKAGNGKCDPECDAYVCQYDNYECSYTSSIYKNCKAIKDGIPCYSLVNNGHCDSECNNKDCLYDGWDCKNMTLCNPIYDAYCKSHFKDGNCDQGCNTEECGWDGLDCVQTKDPRYAEGVLVIVVLVPVDVFVKNSADFLRNLSLLLHGTLVIKKDKNGADMVYSWPGGEDGYFQRRKRSVWDWLDIRQRRSALSGTKFYAKLDNTNCQAQCFPDAELAAEFLAQSMRQGYNPGYPLYSVNSESDSSTTDRPPTVPVVVSVISIVVVVVVVAVVVTELRKRGYGKTWFPEGFCFLPITHSVHRGQDSSKRVMSFSSSDAPPSTAESITSCSDDESFHSKAKRHKSEKEDSRGWTRIHLEAAGTIPKPAILPFTPPQNDQHEIRDINVRGPGGLTPLMLASMASSEMPCMGYDGHDGTSIITELINDGASIHCKTDHTGETPLHLAARYSRSDAAKRLLDAGADPNVPDNLGRTPLHAAVTADAVGVFQILLRHRMTTVNARMKDGTTPLILAVRLAIEGIVEELINAEADVGAADDLGKTALHWAAAVNNVTAAMLLLRHGANKDAQDDHNQTPLFVAAREGSRDVALLLLQNSASIDIPDHVEHLPRDIALERCHHDIVQLLDNYSFNLASDGMGGTSVSAVMSSYMAQGAKGKQKRPSKKQRVVKETELHKIDHCLQFPPHMSGQFVHLPMESAKKQKKRSVAPGFASPSSRGCVRATMHGNGMDMAGRMVEYPPSYDQSCQGRRAQYMTQATLSSLSGNFMDPLDIAGAYQGAGAMLGGDGHQDQAMAVHSWYSFDDYPNQFAGGLDHNMQWPGHVSSTIPKTDLAFGSYGDGYLCQQQGHPSYQEETANALDMLDSGKFGVCPSDTGTINQNCQYDDVNNHVGAYPVLDVHELPLNSKNRQMLSAFDDKNFFQINNQPNSAVLFDSGKILPSMSTYDKTNAAAAHGQDPTNSTGAVIKNSAFMDNSPTAGVQSFLHPSAKGSPDDCGHSMHHMKPTKYVLPLSQYTTFPQQRAQSCSNEASSLVAAERSANPARSGLQKPSFPTPPSQHDLQSDTPPQQLSSCVPRELYPTPSPDSLSPWSNSPIQSAKPDWLDKIKHSPHHQPAGLPAQSISGLKEEPSFFV